MLDRENDAILDRILAAEYLLSTDKTMTTVVAQEYDAFASDYHWLYSDRVLSGDPFLDGYAHVLRSLPPQARILDCACGIGIHSLALARRGYDVRALTPVQEW